MDFLLLIVVNYIHAFQYPLTHLLISTFTHYCILVFKAMQLPQALLQFKFSHDL